MIWTSPTRSTSRRVARPLAAAVALVTGATLLSGCSLWSRDLTLEPYAPSDGLQVDLGEVVVRNALVVSDGEGEPGVVSATVVNRGEEASGVRVEVGGTSQVVEVEAGQSVQLGGPDGEQVLVEEVTQRAGDVIELGLTTGDAGTVTLEVPIKRPTGTYAEIVPQGGVTS